MVWDEIGVRVINHPCHQNLVSEELLLPPTLTLAYLCRYTMSHSLRQKSNNLQLNFNLLSRLYLRRRRNRFWPPMQVTIGFITEGWLFDDRCFEASKEDTSWMNIKFKHVQYQNLTTKFLRNFLKISKIKHGFWTKHSQTLSLKIKRNQIKKRKEK